MDNIYQETEDTVNIFKEECEEILRNFVVQLDLYEKNKDINILTNLMRNAHSIKGSAGIAGFLNIQKFAHNIEDFLSEIKNNRENNYTPLFLKKEEGILSNIRNLVVKTAEELKNDNNFNIKNAGFYDEILKKISLLKNDSKISDELVVLTRKIFDNTNSVITKDLLQVLNNIFVKLKNSSDINKNIINSISGAFKVIKKIMVEDNEEVKDELFFVKQRLSVVEQMLFSVNSEKRENRPTATTKKSDVIPDIFKILGQESIKTLRIETSKIDNLYENLWKLENISETNQKSKNALYDLSENFSTKIFEFEKIYVNIKKLIEQNEKLKTEAKVLKKLYENLNLFEENIKQIQQEFIEYDKIKQDNDKNNHEFWECLYNVENTVKNIRILPIGVILHMFPRMVRDIANSVNKEIVMEIKGSETGIDKKILEEIKMPLIHLLRNAVDHGIETPEIREKQGKNIAGKITISAKNYDNKLIIKVSDDGCGINFDKIKEKALKEKLLGNSEIKKYKKKDFLQMLFKPGFSTEDKVTELSGRGMGLDIVYTQITALNGQININTQKGKGTEVVLTIPSGYFSEKNLCNDETIKYNGKILLVDDSKTTLMHFSKILKKAGFYVNTINNAKDGLKELRTNSYNLLISDVEMPEMDGVEFVSKIRKNKKLKKLPVFILSMLNKDKLENLFKDLNISKIINKAEYTESDIISSIKAITNQETV